MPWRQTYLGASPNNTLSLLRRPQLPLPCKPLGLCSIAKLPEELLASILEFLPPDLYDHDRKTSYSLWSIIPTTCSQWQRLYEPILYHEIGIGSSEGQSPHRTWRLTRTLHERPQLCDYVRCLTVSQYSPVNVTCHEVVGIIERCRSIRHLDLKLKSMSTNWSIIHATGRLPNLTSLSLSPPSPAVQMLLAHFGMPTFKD